MNSCKISWSWIQFTNEFMYMKNIVKSYPGSCVPRFQMITARPNSSSAFQKGKLLLVSNCAAGGISRASVAKLSIQVWGRRPARSLQRPTRHRHHDDRRARGSGFPNRVSHHRLAGGPGRRRSRYQWPSWLDRESRHDLSQSCHRPRRRTASIIDDINDMPATTLLSEAQAAQLN